MAVRKVVESKKKDVSFLVGVDPEYVSLVRHGANQQPFRIVKSEKKGGEKMSMVVQSILLPQHVKIDDLLARQGLEWLSEAKVEKASDHGEYQKLEQLAVEKFDQGSLNLVKLDKSGTFALVGNLIDGADVKDALTIGRDLAEKMPEIAAPPMDMPIAEIPRPAFVLTFRDMFEKELSSFLDVVRGSLSQSESNTGQRKKMVMDALGAFKSFLSIGLDAIGGAPAKIDKQEIVLGGQEKLEGGKTMFQFENEGEFTDKVTQIVTGALKLALKTDEPAPDDAKDKSDKSDKSDDTDKTDKTDASGADDQLKQLMATVGELSTAVKGLTEKTDKLEQQPATDAAALNSEDEGAVDKKDKSGDGEKPSVFAGLLTKEQAAA